jgi:hypothetical protein
MLDELAAVFMVEIEVEKCRIDVTALQLAIRVGTGVCIYDVVALSAKCALQISADEIFVFN